MGLYLLKKFYEMSYQILKASLDMAKKVTSSFSQCPTYGHTTLCPLQNGNEKLASFSLVYLPVLKADNADFSASRTDRTTASPARSPISFSWSYPRTISQASLG